MATQIERLSAEQVFRALCRNETPLGYAELLKSLETPLGRDIFALAYAIGALDPLVFIRPGPHDLEEIYQKTITVGPATFREDCPPATPADPALCDGRTVVPTDGLLARFCAPEGKILVLREAEVTPADLTATEFGSVVYKKISALTFSEGFCFSGEAGAGDEAGTFQSIQNLILPAKAGIDIYARNLNPYSPATFKIRARYWTTC